MKEILQRQCNLFDFNLEIESFTFALDASGGPGLLPYLLIVQVCLFHKYVQMQVALIRRYGGT